MSRACTTSHPCCRRTPRFCPCVPGPQPSTRHGDTAIEPGGDPWMIGGCDFCRPGGSHDPGRMAEPHGRRWFVNVGCLERRAPRSPGRSRRTPARVRKWRSEDERDGASGLPRYQGWVGQPPCHQVLLYCLGIVADQEHSGALLAPRKSRVGRLEADGAKVCWVASPPIPSMARSPDTTPCGIDSRDAARVRAAGMSGSRPCEDGCCYEVLCSRCIAGRCRRGSVADGMFHVEPGRPRVPVRV